MTKLRTEYLGDSVYVEYDGVNLELFLNNGETDPFDKSIVKKSKITLDPYTLAALIRFIDTKANGKTNS